MCFSPERSEFSECHVVLWKNITHYVMGGWGGATEENKTMGLRHKKLFGRLDRAVFHANGATKKTPPPKCIFRAREEQSMIPREVGI